jgi:hypothetical protein
MNEKYVNKYDKKRKWKRSHKYTGRCVVIVRAVSKEDIIAKKKRQSQYAWRLRRRRFMNIQIPDAPQNTNSYIMDAHSTPTRSLDCCPDEFNFVFDIHTFTSPSLM